MPKTVLETACTGTDLMETSPPQLEAVYSVLTSYIHEPQTSQCNNISLKLIGRMIGRFIINPFLRGSKPINRQINDNKEQMQPPLLGPLDSITEKLAVGGMEHRLLLLHQGQACGDRKRGRRPEIAQGVSQHFQPKRQICLENFKTAFKKKKKKKVSAAQNSHPPSQISTVYMNDGQ